MLYFPGSWAHEVHNLTPDSKAITNAVPWPKEKEILEEEKDCLPDHRRDFKRKVKVVGDYEGRQLQRIYLEKFDIYKVLYKCSPAKSDTAISEADK